MALVWASWTLCFALAFFHSAVARQFEVGGRKGWVVPSGGEPQTYNDWAGRNRFMIGDTLLFKYNPAEDSVLQVTAHQYDACNTSSPIASFKGGNTVFRLSRHGPLHFITGNRSNCQKGEKLLVVVLAPRNRSHGAPAPTLVSPGPSAVAASPSSIPSPAPPTKVPSSSPSPAPVVSAPSPSPVPVGAATSPSSSPAPLVAVSPPLSSPAFSPPSPSPLTATPPSSHLSPSTATPSASQNRPTAPAPPPSASPPTLVTALNLVMPLLFALKILTIY
eukprot:PITA_08678